MELKEANFTIDTLEGQTFSGYTLGEEWNGWACPYFTFEQANKLLETYRSMKTYEGKPLRAYYYSNTDKFCFEVDSHEDIQEFSPVEVEGKKLYPIGSGDWIWQIEETTESKSNLTI